jgi:hypothetical protein
MENDGFLKKKKDQPITIGTESLNHATTLRDGYYYASEM